MADLGHQGYYQVHASLLEAIQGSFWAGCCDDAGSSAAIGSVWQQHRYLCDPHTATGWAVAEDYVNQTGDTRPMVVLSTASPYKFPAAVLSAIGIAADGDEFRQMEQLQQTSGVPIPKNLAKLEQMPELHTAVIDKEAMAQFALNN